MAHPGCWFHSSPKTLPGSSSPPQLPDPAFEAPPPPTRDVSPSTLRAPRGHPSTPLGPTQLTPLLGPHDLMASAHTHMRTSPLNFPTPALSLPSFTKMTPLSASRVTPWLLPLPTALPGYSRFHSPRPTVGVGAKTNPHHHLPHKTGVNQQLWQPPPRVVISTLSAAPSCPHHHTFQPDRDLAGLS